MMPFVELGLDWWWADAGVVVAVLAELAGAGLSPDAVPLSFRPNRFQAGTRCAWYDMMTEEREERKIGREK